MIFHHENSTVLPQRRLLGGSGDSGGKEEVGAVRYISSSLPGKTKMFCGRIWIYFTLQATDANVDFYREF